MGKISRVGTFLKVHQDGDNCLLDIESIVKVKTYGTDSGCEISTIDGQVDNIDESIDDIEDAIEEYANS